MRSVRTSRLTTVAEVVRRATVLVCEVGVVARVVVAAVVVVAEDFVEVEAAWVEGLVLRDLDLVL